MAHRILFLLKDLNGVIFASLIKRGTHPPPDFQYVSFLRKDHVFLFEKFSYFLGEKLSMALSSWMRRIRIWIGNS